MSVKGLGILLGLSTIIGVTANGYKPGIRVKFGSGLGFGETFSYKVSTTIGDAIFDGWSQCRRPPGPLPQLLMYCPEDKIVCALFDDTGYIAGIQIALKHTFTNNPFDPIIQGFTKWLTDVDGKWASMWALPQYFVSKEFLRRSPISRLKSRNSKQILQDGGVWLTGTYGELMKVSSKEVDIRQSIFTEQGCFPGMGLHYFYNYTTNTECTAEQIYPWFLLAYQGRLTATAFTAVGQIPIQQGARDWFERPDVKTMKKVAPRGPECQFDLVNQFGVLTIHVYYINDPRSITCINAIN